ncbi:MAG: hypothetical protein AABW73_03175 [Nanoarchaeota archaeon]
MNGSCYGSSCGSFPIGRNFLTRDEKIEMLREYKKSLDQESKGIAERISQLEDGESVEDAE